MSIKKIIVPFLLVMAFVSPLRGDSDTRPKTAAEKSFFQKVIQACGTAVAGIKTVWEEDSRSGDEETDYINTDSEKYPLVHYYRIAWQDNARIQEARSKLEQEMLLLIPAMQENMNSDKTSGIEKLAEQLGKAAEAGNIGEMERIQKEIEVLSAKMKADMAPLDKNMKDLTEKNAPRDVELSVRIAINNFSESFDTQPQSGKLSSGMPFYRIEDSRMSNESWVEGTTWVFLGSDWKSRQEGETIYMEHPEFVDRPYTAVRTVVVRVQGDNRRALETLNSMNFSALQALIK